MVQQMNMDSTSACPDDLVLRESDGLIDCLSDVNELLQVNVCVIGYGHSEILNTHPVVKST